MVTIELDEHTAAAIEENARMRGLTISEYVRSLLPIPPPALPNLTWEELERELMELTFDGPSLPENFSREDIYFDHD